MTVHRVWKAVACLVLAAFSAAAQDGASEIRARIQSLQQSLRDEPLQGDFAGLQSTAGELLQASTAALDAGKMYLSLEKLAQASDYLAGAKAAAHNAAVVKEGLPAFEVEWNKTSVTLASFDRELRAKKWNDAPAAIRALSEASLVKATPLLDGGRGFATSTKPQDGLFYVGEALGEARVRQILRRAVSAPEGPCDSVAFAAAGTASVAGENQRRLSAAAFHRTTPALHRPELDHQAGEGAGFIASSMPEPCTNISRRCGTSACSTRPPPDAAAQAS